MDVLEAKDIGRQRRVGTNYAYNLPTSDLALALALAASERAT